MAQKRHLSIWICQNVQHGELDRKLCWLPRVSRRLLYFSWTVEITDDFMIHILPFNPLSFDGGCSFMSQSKLRPWVFEAIFAVHIMCLVWKKYAFDKYFYPFLMCLLLTGFARILKRGVVFSKIFCVVDFHRQFQRFFPKGGSPLLLRALFLVSMVSPISPRHDNVSEK
jgi:hypothetical protein